MTREKKTVQRTIWIPETLDIVMMKLAANDDRKYSDYVCHAMALHAFGHYRHLLEEDEAEISGDSHR